MQSVCKGTQKQIGIQLQFCPLPKIRVYLQTAPSYPQQKWVCQGDHVPSKRRAGHVWGYGHCSLRSTGDCGKWVKPLQSEQSLKGRTSPQGAVGSKGIMVGFLFWYGFCLFVCFKLLFLFCLTLRFFLSFQFVAQALGLKAFWCPWQAMAREKCCSCPQSCPWLEAHHSCSPEGKGDWSTDHFIFTQRQ